MKYVLDSSVAFKWVVAKTLSDRAQLVHDDYRNKIHKLLSPVFAPLSSPLQRTFGCLFMGRVGRFD